MNRRQAISKLSAGLIGATITGVSGFVAGSYLAPFQQPRQVQPELRERTVTVERTLERTLTQTVTTQPRLEPVPLRFVATEGGVTTAPNALMAKNLQDRGPQVGLRFESFNVVRGTGEAVRELTDGRADVIGPVSVLSLMGAIERQPNIRIFYFNDYGAYAGIVVGPNVPYRSLEDMRRAIEQGRKIKIAFTRPGSLSHSYSILLARLLGVEYGREIEGVSLGEDAAIIAALVRGDVDAYTTANIILGWSLEEEGRGRVIFYFRDRIGTQWHELSYATTTEVMTRSREAIRRFVTYIRETTRIAMLDKELTVSNMTADPPRGLGVKRPAAERYYSFYLPNMVGAPVREALQPMREIAVNAGITRNPPEPQQLYTTEFL